VAAIVEPVQHLDTKSEDKKVCVCVSV
jgi:hypothetical protein